MFSYSACLICSIFSSSILRLPRAVSSSFLIWIRRIRMLSFIRFVFRLERDTGPSASHVLKYCLPLFIAEWEQQYGWRPLHIETLVDPSEVSSEVPGYCYRRSGFRSLGMTTGRSARRPAGHSRGARVWSDSTPKLVLYRGPLPRIELR